MENAERAAETLEKELEFANRAREDAEGELEECRAELHLYQRRVMELQGIINADRGGSQQIREQLEQKTRLLEEYRRQRKSVGVEYEELMANTLERDRELEGSSFSPLLFLLLLHFFISFLISVSCSSFPPSFSFFFPSFSSSLFLLPFSLLPSFLPFSLFPSFSFSPVHVSLW